MRRSMNKTMNLTLAQGLLSTAHLSTALLVSTTLLSAALPSPAWAASEEAARSIGGPVSLGPRPFFLVEDLDEDSERERTLKTELRQCATDRRDWRRTDFSIGHRGAPMQFPEHTRESYLAAARMGAGVLECDVTFTADQALVCRHSQCDLHSTTNILETDLAQQCSVPPAFDPDSGELTNAQEIQCCTSDISLAEFKSLEGKMEGADLEATSIAAYLDGTPAFRTDGYASRGTLMTHAESIALFQALGVKMTPELKEASVAMPFEGYSQRDYAQQMIDDYKAAGVPAGDVFPQSFELDDVRYWLEHEPAFGEQAVFLDDRYDDEGFAHDDPASWSPSMEELAGMGVTILAPPMWMLLAADPGADGGIVPSIYAERARAAGLDLIAWSFERSAPLSQDGAWYHQTTDAVVDNDGDKLLSLDVLARDIGVRGVFSDWPATVSFYANCTMPDA